jgi:hypothetical protein
VPEDGDQFDDAEQLAALREWVATGDPFAHFLAYREAVERALRVDARKARAELLRALDELGLGGPEPRVTKRGRSYAEQVALVALYTRRVRVERWTPEAALAEIMRLARVGRRRALELLGGRAKRIDPSLPPFTNPLVPPRLLPPQRAPRKKKPKNSAG